MQSAVTKILRRGSIRGKSTFSKDYKYFKAQRTPPWITSEHVAQINAMNLEAKKLSLSTGVRHEVDHIVPLRGKTVSGLHVPWNLQIITKSKNASKRNHF